MSIPAPVVEYVMKLEDALYTIRRLYTNPAIKSIVSDALSNRELFLNLVDAEITIPEPAEFDPESAELQPPQMSGAE